MKIERVGENWGIVKRVEVAERQVYSEGVGGW